MILRRGEILSGLTWAAALALVLAAPLSGQATIPAGRVVHGTLSFDGHSTLGNFVGTTDSVTGEMRGGPELSGVRGWVEARVSSMRTGNGHRDRDMNSSMESARYPVMRFDLDGVTPGPVIGDAQQVGLRGGLTLHGVTRQEDLTATLHRELGSARVTTSFQLNLTDYQIGGLSKMLGVLRMNETIVVHVDVTFAASP